MVRDLIRQIQSEQEDKKYYVVTLDRNDLLKLGGVLAAVVGISWGLGWFVGSRAVPESPLNPEAALAEPASKTPAELSTPSLQPEPAAEVPPPAEPKESSKEPPARVPPDLPRVTTTSAGQYCVQFGAFLGAANARRLLDSLPDDFRAGLEERTDAQGRHWYLVRAGRFADAAAARQWLTRIGKVSGMQGVVRRRGRF